MSKYLLIVDRKFIAGTYNSVEEAKKASKLVRKPATFQIVEFDPSRVEFYCVE